MLGRGQQEEEREEMPQYVQRLQRSLKVPSPWPGTT